MDSCEGPLNTERSPSLFIISRSFTIICVGGKHSCTIEVFPK